MSIIPGGSFYGNFRKEGLYHGKECDKGYDHRIPDEADPAILYPPVFWDAVPAVLQYAKRKENLLILRSIDAVGKLTYADAIAIRDGKTNGEMKSAIEAYKKADEEMYEFLLEQTTKN